MNYLEKRIEEFRQQIVNDLVFKLNCTLSSIRNDIISLVKNEVALPAFITIEAPDGRTGASNIVWLKPSGSQEVRIHPYIAYPIGSLIKVESPFLITQLRIGDIYQLGSESQTCRSLKTRDELFISMNLQAIITYPSNG